MTLGLLVASYMTFVKYTTRWDIERSEQVTSIIEGKKRRYRPCLAFTLYDADIGVEKTIPNALCADFSFSRG